MNLASTIKSRRKALGISQNDLAEMAGVSLATVKNLDRGKCNPSYENLIKILDVLGLEMEFRVKSPFYNPNN